MKIATKFVLYGVEHSPWVQGVRLALAHHKVPTTLTSVPFGFGWFLRYGVVFPALQLADGTRLVDSFAIYEHLDQLEYSMGTNQIPPDDRHQAQVELEKLFTSYALGRVIEHGSWGFVTGWAAMCESPYRLRGICCRAFLACYFLVLIQMGVWLKRRKGYGATNTPRVRELLTSWNARLQKDIWLTGSQPGFLDFALLGHIQCMTSGLTDSVHPLVMEQPALMGWLKRMLELLQGHQPMYAKRLVDSSFQPQIATPKERRLFWLFLAGWVLLAPLTALLIFLCLILRLRNPAHSGAVIARHHSKRAQT